MMREEDARKMRILYAIVEDFIRSGTPVGSRTLTKITGLGVSSATIRNEMADLEDMGYLISPHVSAGRVPSQKAYRLYVTDLMQPGLSEAERARLQGAFAARLPDMESALTHAAQVLSDLAGYTAAVLIPRQGELTVSGIHFIPAGTGRALLIVMTREGARREAMLRVSDRLDDQALFSIGRMLTGHLAGATLSQMRTALYGLSARSDADARVLRGLSDLAAQMEKQAQEERVLIAGAHSILSQPEYADARLARPYLEVMRDERALKGLLQTALAAPTVKIGGEIGIEALAGCAAVLSPYRMGKQQGALGIIGPIRLPYARMTDLVQLFSEEMTALLSA